MANIFDGIKALSDDEIRLEIALFSQVNFTNAAKETGNRFIGSLADMAGSLLKSFGGKADISYDVVLVTDMVRKECEALKSKDREWLLNRLRLVILERLGVGAASNIESSIASDVTSDITSDETSGVEPGVVGYSDDAISVMVLQEACVDFGIEKYDTPANKLEKLSIEYNKALISSIHNMLVGQTAQQAVDTNKRIQKALDAVDIEEKRHLQRMVMPKEFSGAGIGRVLRLERGVKNLTYVVECLGIECFDEVYVYSATAVGAMKMLRRISRVLLAQLVWLSYRSYKGSFGVDESLLPSYMSEGERFEYDVVEKQFRGYIADKKLMEEKTFKAQSAYDRGEEQLSNAKDKLVKLVEEQKELVEKFDKLKAQKDTFVGGQMPDNETKRYYSEVNETNRQVDRAELAVQKQNERILEQQLRNDKLLEQLTMARKDMEEAEAVVAKQIEALTSELRGKWRAFFFRMQFADEVFAQVAQDFQSSERLVIETFLKEIHDSESFKKAKSYEAFETGKGKLRLRVSKSVTAYIEVADGVIVYIGDKESAGQKKDEKDMLEK